MSFPPGLESLPLKQAAILGDLQENPITACGELEQQKGLKR